MTADVVTDWPIKRREMIYWAADSRPWNDFRFRDDDVVVVTWSKSGTTWMQQILAQLILGGADTYGPDHSPWIDSRFMPEAAAQAEAQTHRRFLKSHLPLDALVYSPRARYLYIGRDIRDIFWSWYNHWANFTPEFLAHLNALPGREGPPAPYPDPDMRAAFRDWLRRDGYPCWPFFEHVQGWFEARHLPNLLLVHYADLKRDLAGEIGRIARFLGIGIAPERLPEIVGHCSFAHMQRLARRDEILGRIFRQGGATLIHKGTNGRWRDVLTPADIAFCETVAAQRLSADCRTWLATGRLPPGAQIQS